jgi:hypothetical protein
MAQQFDSNDLDPFKKFLMANSIQIDALAQLMIRKDFIAKEKFLNMLKEVQAEYQSSSDD